MSDFLTILQNASGLKWLFVVACMVVVWFLPAMLAYFFNRKHAKLILLACIPAGFSLLAWGALLLWATTGKAVKKYLPEQVKRRLASST